MSKIGDYIIQQSDSGLDTGEYGYLTEHENDSYDDTKRYLVTQPWYDLDQLPVDVKERLQKVGIEDFLLYDDVPF